MSGPSQPRSSVGHTLTASDIQSGNQEAIDADAEQLPQDRKWGQDQPMHLTDADLKDERRDSGE